MLPGIDQSPLNIAVLRLKDYVTYKMFYFILSHERFFVTFKVGLYHLVFKL